MQQTNGFLRQHPEISLQKQDSARPEGQPWTLDQASEFLQVSTKTIVRMGRAGRIKVIRIGRRILVPDAEIKRVAAGE